MDTSLTMKKFENVMAFRSPKGRVVGFHMLNMEVAELSEQAWQNGLNLDEVMSWSRSEKEELSQKEKSLPQNTVRALTINVTQVCNLHCTYCAAGGDGSYGDPVKKIAIEKTLPQIKFFFSKLKTGDEFRMTFLGGEPLLYPEALLILSEYTRELAKEKSIRVQFVVVTNGTQFTTRNIEILTQMKADITISIDGPPQINDELRPNKGGKGVTKEILQGLNQLLDFKPQLGRIGLSGVFGSRNEDLEKAYLFYSEYPVDWFDFTYDHLETRAEVSEKFTRSLLRIADLAFQKGGAKELRRIKIFDQYFQAFESQQKNKNYCGAGKTFLMVDARNQIYTCPWVVGDSKEIVGQGETLFKDRLAAYAQDLVEQNKCHNCWARYVCGGGCMFIHKNKTGDKHQVDTNFCTRTQTLIAASLLYYEESHSQENDQSA